MSFPPETVALEFLFKGVWDPPESVFDPIGAGPPASWISLLFYLTSVFMLKLAPVTSEDIWVLTVEKGWSDKEREDMPLPLEAPPKVEYL